VLVIDDEPGIRGLLDMLLRPQGYRQEHPDVILLDLKIDEVPPSPPRGSGRFVRWSAP
jgi:DNA-binding response OmpR family regulator